VNSPSPNSNKIKLADPLIYLVCTKCGDIKEFCDSEIEMRQQKVAQDRSFQMTGHQLLIFGICQACSNDSQENEAS